ncbi:hypothetical protein [Neptunomonas antarctica]|uniref:SET domain-containing protein n=1 Tax=Neptunomonas antarctica TaxID=619304 RepID=A0A1N7L7Z9_9GAMM|nr:hypothetical protein [Neptunomonas antarctica]SIS69937.1 hypothetical protein SAMN05421760_103302 [Neptunomonas antarctica]
MNFSEILEEFRTLGGTANNIELRKGIYGHGIYPLDVNKAIKIVTPPELLISPNLLYLDRSNQLKVKAKTDLNPKLIDFFEKYQRFFGWGNGAITELDDYHRELCRLPKIMQQYLVLFGWDYPDFDKKKPKDYLNEYFISRQIRIENESKIMPIIDLINHSSAGIAYTADNGVSVEGMFKSEVLTRYHGSFDAFHFYKNYRIAVPSNIVLSCDVKINVPNVGSININRFDSIVDKVSDVIIPNIFKKDGEIRMSFVPLANKNKNAPSKQIFVEQIQKFNVPESTAYQIFDGLIEHNKQALTKLLDECMKSNSKIARELQVIALNQLALISA